MSIVLAPRVSPTPATADAEELAALASDGVIMRCLLVVTLGCVWGGSVSGPVRARESVEVKGPWGQSCASVQALEPKWLRLGFPESQEKQETLSIS